MNSLALFQSLLLHKQLLKALEKMNLIEPTGVQSQTIPLILEGKDLMVSAQTGSGKTAAFLLPILQNILTKDAPKSSTRGLILLPTRELALQTKDYLERLSSFTHIKCGLIIGGEAFKHQIATLRKNPEIIIATPGRLVEHIERGTPDFNDLEVLVLDEADRMLDMGFAIDMHTIATSCNNNRQNLLFSATLHHKELGRIKSTFTDPKYIEVNPSRQHPPQIVQQIILCDNKKHKEALIGALIDEEKAQKVFIFCKTRVQCQELSNLLRYKKYRSACIHGEIPQSDRKQIMNKFRQGSVEILVATDLAARGLDINHVELVINFNVALSGDEHIHRIGRTGRAGTKGKAVTLIEAVDWNQMSSIERYLKIRFEKREIKELKASYGGPKNIKNSGKIAGTKKKKLEKKANKTKNKPKPAKTKHASMSFPKKMQSSSRKKDGSGVLLKKK
jgi:superfamily II DNA/RNA helicase